MELARLGFQRGSKARTVAERLLTGAAHEKVELAEQVGVNPETVNRVIDMLRREGARIERTEHGRRAIFRVIGWGPHPFPSVRDLARITGAEVRGDDLAVSFTTEAGPFRGVLVGEPDGAFPFGRSALVEGVRVPAPDDVSVWLRLDTDTDPLLLRHVQGGG